MPKRQRAPRYSTVASQAEEQISGIREADVDVDANTNQSVSRKRSSLGSKDFLLKLLTVCENHRNSCHPDYDPTSERDDSEIPHDKCRSAIAPLRLFIPKLERTISKNSTIDSKDILQLCGFYDNVVRGTYCPHLPSLFGSGPEPRTDPRIILEKVAYLLRNSLYVHLDWNDVSTNNEKTDRGNAINPAIAFFDVVGRAISGLFGSVIDDSRDHIRRKLFVDWIDFCEHVAQLSIMREQDVTLPLQLGLFGESSFAIQQRFRETQHPEDGREQSLGDDGGIEEFHLDIDDWNQVFVLQVIAFKVLSFMTSDVSALERMSLQPDRLWAEPSVLLGGDMDIFFPSGIVLDYDLVSTLLASLKPAMLMPSSRNGDLSCNEFPHVTATAVQILLRLCLDWHRLGIATVAMPLLPCMIDAAVLTVRTVQNVLLGRQKLQQKDLDEKQLAFLLDRMVCHPPGHDTNDFDNVSSVAKEVYSTVWTTLLDCLEGIAARRRLRQERNAKDDDEHQRSAADSRNTITPPPTSTSSIVLDLAVLDTIHYIAATTPALALEGSNYCTARGIFPLLFVLSSDTTWQNNHDWNDHGSLLRAANQSLALFIRASIARDATSDSMLDNVCRGVLKGRGKSFSGGVGRGEQGPDGLDEAISGVTKPNSKGDGGNNIRNDGYSLKRKRELSMSKQSYVSASTKCKQWDLNEISGATTLPTTWYSALRSFLDLAVDAGDKLRDSFKTAASQSWECDGSAMGRILEQLRYLSGGFRLALSLSRTLSITTNIESEYWSATGISRVAHELSMQLVSCCDMLLKQIDAFQRPLGYMMTDVVLECGLLMHFSKEEASNGWDDAFTAYIDEFLDALASFCGKFLEIRPLPQFDLSSRYKFAGMPVYFSGAENHDHFGPQYCFDFTSQLHNSEKQIEDWLFDRSITTLSSLPLFVRAALMLSLRPVEVNVFSDQSKEEGEACSLVGHYSLDLFAEFFNRYAEEVDNIELAEFDSSRRVASLLHLLPLMTIPRAGTGGTLFRKSLGILFQKRFNPLIQAFRSKDTMIFQGLCFALSSIRLSKTIGVATSNPAGVLQIMSMRHLPLRSIESSKDQFRQMSLDVANKGVRNDENPVSRYFLWMCGASYCMSASPSEILHCAQNIKSGQMVEKVDESILPHNGLLPWLVAAPFSDPDAFLRKFVSRELSTLFMSKDYGFLLSRFASSEEFKEYYAYSAKERKEKSENVMHTLYRMSDHVIDGLFEEIDGLLKNVSLAGETEGMKQGGPFDHYRHDNELVMQQVVSKTLASLCFNAGLNHPIGRILFEKSIQELIRMWASSSTKTTQLHWYDPKLSSTPAGRALTFGSLLCLSGSRDLAPGLSGDELWTQFPSAPFRIVQSLGDKTRREQYELLERMVNCFFVYSEDSLYQKETARRALRVVSQSIPSTIAQLVNEKDEKTIQLTTGFYISLAGRSGTTQYRALSMGDDELQKETKRVCLKYIEHMLPLILSRGDEEGAPLSKFFQKLIAPETLPGMIVDRGNFILKGIAWELGRDPYRLESAVCALRTAAEAWEKSSLNTYEPVVEAFKGTNAAKLWVTKQFMYLMVNMVQLNWQSRTTAHKVQALRCLHVLLDFLNASDACQYLPQVLSTVNSAITPNRADGVYDPDGSSLLLYAVRCLSKFTRLAAQDNIESVVDNLTTIVVSLLPILGEDSVDRDGILYQEAQNEAATMLEFLTKAEFIRKYPKAFSQIPFLPTTALLTNVHTSLRDNGINFGNLLILSTGTSESLTGENFGASTSSVSSSSGDSVLALQNRSGDNVLALQNRISLISSLLYDEKASVRKVGLKHLVDLLRANRNLFHILVENEGGSSVRNFLTLVYERIQNGSNEISRGCANNATSATVSNTIDILMQRCVLETDEEVRLELATCLGEIGAIGEHRLDDMSLFRPQGNGSISMYEWRLDQPPWQSRATKYELQLVTKHLATALKAASSQVEQFKIGFTIQQLLLLLDASVGENNKVEETNQLHSSKKREMSKWLLDRLVESDVHESVGPFWLSEFHAKAEKPSNRQPPFFNESKSYHHWIGEFCRWMIWKTKDCRLSRWKDFFFACRIAVRCEIGLEAAEFILPLLVLDRICFGSKKEFESICQEFLLILDFESDDVSMDSSERQKAACGFFSIIETLEHWAEIEAEQRFKSRKSSDFKRSSRGSARKNSSSGRDDTSLSNWSADEAITQIKELISCIPLVNQARAATKVGMHAKGLRLLELVARKNIVRDFFESSSEEDKTDEISLSGNIFQRSLLRNVNIDLMKTVLSNLNDFETLNVIGETSYLVNPLLQVTHSIQWKEASGDFEGALRDYDRATQARRFCHPTVESVIENGELDCMLELGRFESVLSFATAEGRYIDELSTKAIAAEAAARLGRWDELSKFVSENETNGVVFSPRDAYRQATGKAMICLRDRRWELLGASLRTARTAVMDSLSSVARESYSRAYIDIARLQSIRELEDAGAFFRSGDGRKGPPLREIVESTLPDGWAWEGRLRLTTPRAASSIMNTRVAIARLGKDPVMETSLLLDIGKQSCDNGMHTTAENFFSQAEAVLSMIPVSRDSVNSNLDSLLNDVRVQYASLKKESGENLLGLKIIGHTMVQNALVEMNRNKEDIGFMEKIAVKYERERVEKAFGKVISVGSDRKLIDRFTDRLLRLTQWTVEAGMQSGNEIMESFQVVIKLSPQWEKGHFEFAKYLNDLVARFFEKDSPHGMEEDLIRFHALYREKVCHKYILLAIEHYATTLRRDMKHVYQALPRLLSLWFDFVSVRCPSSADDVPSVELTPDYLDFLAKNQDQANALMVSNTKAIPAAAYYTAMPQLISRVTHEDKDTANVVKRILERVLTKFPLQAMWHLAWLKGSSNAKRQNIGKDIFTGAQKALIKNRQTEKVANLLKESDSLFKFLRDLARYTPPEKKKDISVKSWKSEEGLVDLSEFIPPVQAALSISPFKPVKSSSKEYFPRVIPRMRAISSKVVIMQSLAKPKKIKVFAVPGTWKHTNVVGSTSGSERSSSSSSLDCDIGEIHFLVKQEKTGDLRKDARVQDLNNVINRLMASSNNSNSTLSSKSRRLRVRTFAVTCLSEDTGILEWVPDTEALRRLVSKSYNPQVSSLSDRRRGSKMTNFANPSLRRDFVKAQNQFVEHGDLAQAVKLYYLLLKHCPPVLSWWFIQNFRSATDWYEARQKFALTAAAWSAIGHVIGLGDRHSENILVEVKTGRVVHVDFDCIFDKALLLKRPEVVPFRLTPNMLDAFGPTGADGVFRSGMESSLGILRKNRETLLSVLEPFIKDPVINFKRSRSQRGIVQEEEANVSHKAKRSIKVIKERLSGICNLQNPNYKKLPEAVPEDVRNRLNQENTMKEILPLSVEGQVEKLCAEASKNENLVQMYVGWMPWI